MPQTNLGGKVQLHRRNDGGVWWCSAWVGGKQRRATTKQETLTAATEFAEDWYIELRGKSRAGLLRNEKTFKQAADQFLKEYTVITEGKRSPRRASATRSAYGCISSPPYRTLGQIVHLPWFSPANTSSLPSDKRIRPHGPQRSPLGGRTAA